MNDETVRLYEGLFLINPVRIQSSLARATELVQEVLDRAEAETVAILRWDERKLAYDIRGVKRGLYMLAYFRVKGEDVTSIERDVNLSEDIIRALVLRADHIGEVEIEQAKADAAKTLDAARVQGDSAAEAQTPEPVAADAAE